MKRREFMGLCTSLTIGLAGYNAWGLSEDEATNVVKQTIDELLGLLGSPGGTEGKAQQLLDIMRKHTNIERIAQYAAGRTWRDMSDSQKSNFINAFQHYIGINYAKRFKEYTGQPNIKINRAIDAGKKGIVISTQVSDNNTKPIKVDWLVSDRSGTVQITDLIFEGISLVATQREEIGAMLQKRNGDIDKVTADLSAFK